MSLEFSQELDSPIISPTFAPQDAGEIGLRPKLLSDYTGQRGLTQTGRAIQEGMVQRLIAKPGCLDINGQISLGLFLAGIVAQQLGPQADLTGILRCKGGGNNGAVQLLRKL